MQPSVAVSLSVIVCGDVEGTLMAVIASSWRFGGAQFEQVRRQPSPSWAAACPAMSMSTNSCSAMVPSTDNVPETMLSVTSHVRRDSREQHSRHHRPCHDNKVSEYDVTGTDLDSVGVVRRRLRSRCRGRRAAVFFNSSGFWTDVTTPLVPDIPFSNDRAQQCSAVRSNQLH